MSYIVKLEVCKSLSKTDVYVKLPHVCEMNCFEKQKRNSLGKKIEGDFPLFCINISVKYFLNRSF